MTETNEARDDEQRIRDQQELKRAEAAHNAWVDYFAKKGTRHDR
jgi:hypothetical protein